MEGFHSMISDRLRQPTDMAVRYCKCRIKYINYLYDTHLRPINNDYRGPKYKRKRKSEITRRITGDVKSEVLGRRYTFEDSIEWDRLDKEDKIYWESVNKWAKWFASNMLYIEDNLKSFSEKKYSKDKVIAEIARWYCNNSVKVAEFIVNYSNYGT